MNITDQLILFIAKLALVCALSAVGVASLGFISHRLFTALSSHLRCWWLVITLVNRKRGRKVTEAHLEWIYEDNPGLIGPHMERIGRRHSNQSNHPPDDH